MERLYSFGSEGGEDHCAFRTSPKGRQGSAGECTRMSACEAQNEVEVRANATSRYVTGGEARLQEGGATAGNDEYGRRSVRQERQEERARYFEQGRGENGGKENA